ncbi:hypothetical protein RSJ10_3779 (plasmid) [Clostridium botulinum]|nr:hypothetical protein RSJ10_3779 [Clostridium botulinum]
MTIDTNKEYIGFENQINFEEFIFNPAGQL